MTLPQPCSSAKYGVVSGPVWLGLKETIVSTLAWRVVNARVISAIGCEPWGLAQFSFSRESVAQSPALDH